MKKRLTLLWIPVIFCAVWLVWPDKSVKDDSGANAPIEKLNKKTGRPSLGIKPQKPGKRPSSDADSSFTEDLFDYNPELEDSWNDPSVSSDELARRLRLMVEDSSLPMPVRQEALIHVLNLSIEQFADLAVKNPDLPIELAEIFLARNDVPVIQLRTYLAWMNHPEPEIADQSLEQLRSMVEDGNQEENVERVIEMAIQKINQLKAEEQEPKQPAETANGESPSK